MTNPFLHFQENWGYRDILIWALKRKAEQRKGRKETELNACIYVAAGIRGGETLEELCVAMSS